MVRALPIESDFLISLVCLRVSVILFLASAEPCILRRYSSRRDLSWSVSESSGTRFSTPAARSCSSRTAGGTFSSLANCATLVCATLLNLLVLRRLVGTCLGEPVRARRHDQAIGALLVQTGELHQLVACEVGELIARANAAFRELGRKLIVHAFEAKQLRVYPLHLL